MAMGVAAGVAGSIALANKKEIREVNFSDIRRKIIETGAVLEVPSK
jgi:hypothetical protein